MTQRFWTTGVSGFDFWSRFASLLGFAKKKRGRVCTGLFWYCCALLFAIYVILYMFDGMGCYHKILVSLFLSLNLSYFSL